MAVGHVRADDEEQVGAVEVGVGAGWSVGAQRLLETRSGAGHAQPRVGFQMYGPQVTLRQLGGQILRLQGHLTRHVERDRIRAVLVDDRAQAASGFGDRVADRSRDRLLAACGPHQRCRHATLGGRHQLGMGRTLGAQPPEVGGMQLVSADPRDHRRAAVGVGTGLDRDPAPHPTVGARRPRHVGHLVSRRAPPPGCARCARRCVRAGCAGEGTRTR